jgi:hypothetical protein
LNEVAKTGTLASAGVGVGPAWQSLVDANKRSVSESTGNILEQFGSSGLRYSSDLMTKLVDFNNQNTANQSALFAQLQQDATSKAMGAATAGAGMFSDVGTAMTPSAFVTTGGGPAAATVGGLSQLLPMLSMMKVLFPSTGSSSPTSPTTGGSTVTNLPGSVATGDTSPWTAFVPTNFGPANA